MPSFKTLRVTLQDIVGATGGAGSTATVFARYVDTGGRGRDVHLDDGTIVVPVRRTVTPDTDPEWWDFTVIPSDDPDVREEDQGFLVEVAWVVTAPEGGKTSGAERVLVPSTADAIVQLGSLYSPTAIPAVTAQRIISGGTAETQVYDVRLRTGTSAQWAEHDPILSLGEEGIDTDTGTRKVGDGILAWSALAASGGGGGGGTSVHGDLTGRSVAGQHPISAITDLQAALDAKADDLGADDNYVTDAEKVKLSNLSGTNTGDQTLPTWSTISGKPAVIAEGATQADARTAIGAGTSSFDGVYASLTSKPTLGTAAAAATGDFATAAQGVKADTAVQPTIADAKGDLIAATAADTLARVAVGSAGDSLTPDTAASPGVAWAVPLLKIASTASTSIAPALGDHGKYQRLTAATAVTITLPSDSSVAFPTGSYLLYKATAAGLATFVAGSGATLEDATPSAVMRAEGSLVQATKVASNTWTVDGDLA